MAEDRILDKIRKCLAMANDSRGNAAESANAMRQAQALMQKHGLTETDVQISDIDCLFLRSKVSVRNPMDWEWGLVGMVCEAFGCKPLFHAGGPEPTNKGYFRIIGPKTHIQPAEYTIVVLMRQCVAARTKYVAELPAYHTRGEKSKMANSFCLAWVRGVYRTVSAFVDDGERIKKATDLWIRKNCTPPKQTKEHKNHRYYDAEQAGLKAASSVSLNKAAGTDVNNRVLLK